jgi:hypothetical protein
VVITSPANGQTFLPGDAVLITADVFSFVAPVTKVNFYEGASLIGTATQAPYSVVYQNSSYQNTRHSIDAVATDTLGNTVSTDPGAFRFFVCDDTDNFAYVKIISPARASVFAYGEPILIRFEVRPPCDGLFEGIDLYLDSAFSTHLDPGTFDFVWRNAPLGSHSILGRATGPDHFSDELYITVAASHPPTVAITSPADGAVFNFGADIPVHVTAHDSDGTVVQIQLTTYWTTLTSTASDFDFTLQGGDPWTTFALTATATDNSGVTATNTIYVSKFILAPANDNFANSFDLAQITTGNNDYATREPGEPDSHSPDTAASGDHSVWWHWTAPSDGWAVISTAGSSFPTVVAIYAGDAVDNLRLVSGNNNRYRYPLWAALSAKAQLFATAGTTYQIAIDGFGPYSGYIQLNVSYDVPPTVAITSPAEGAVFSAGADIPVHITAQDADGGLIQVQVTDGTTAFTTSTATDFDYTFHSLADGNYTLSATAIDDLFAVSTNSVHITVGNPARGNDDFAYSFDLEQITTGNNVNATREPGEPASHNPDGASAGHSVWWRWTAPRTGIAVISTEGSSFDTVATIYEGNTVDSLHLVVANNDGNSSQAAIPSFWVQAGYTYRIAIDGVPGAWGDIQLNVRYDNRPTVNLINPVHGDFFALGTPIHLTAIPNDSDGFISKVVFYIDDWTQELQGNSSSYEIDWTPSTGGQHWVKVIAYDNDGWGSIVYPGWGAGEILIYVGQTVRMTTPSDGDSFVLGTPIHFTALVNFIPATEVGIVIDGLQQFRGNTSPYGQFDWTPETRGQHSVSAYAIDSGGVWSWSPAITFFVQ